MKRYQKEFREDLFSQNAYDILFNSKILEVELFMFLVKLGLNPKKRDRDYLVQFIIQSIVK